MFHQKRKHCVSSVPSALDLAEKLTERTWTLCTGFYVAGHPDYLFLDDATSEDSAVEFGIVKRTEEGFIQVESITFSWCDRAKAILYIEQALRGEFDSEGWPVTVQIDESPSHSCHLCA